MVDLDHRWQNTIFEKNKENDRKNGSDAKNNSMMVIKEQKTDKKPCLDR